MENTNTVETLKKKGGGGGGETYVKKSLRFFAWRGMILLTFLTIWFGTSVNKQTAHLGIFIKALRVSRILD